MAKIKTQFVCQQCGRVTARMMGRCPQCGTFNSMVEQVIEEPAKTLMRASISGSHSTPRTLNQIESDGEARWPLPLGELARVLGGGIVPGSLVLVGGDPGIGKCVTADTRLIDPDTGDFLPIIAWQANCRKVASVDENTLRLHPATVSHFLTQGHRRIVRVTTRLGRQLRCTPTHPLLTQHGWKPVAELRPGDRIASPRSLPFFGSEPMPEAEIKLIAHILSEGSAQSNINVTTSLPQVASDLREIARHFGMQLVAYPKRNTTAVQYRFTNRIEDRQQARVTVATAILDTQKRVGISWAEWARQAHVGYSMLNMWRRGRSVPSEAELARLAAAINGSVTDLAAEARMRAEANTPIARFLEKHGLRHARAANKAVPACIFRLPRQQLALFLQTLFTGDGTLFVNCRGLAGFSYSTISRRLAEDIQHLLLRFGLVTKLRTKPSQVNGSDYVAYEVSSVGARRAQVFMSEIGIMGRDSARTALAGLDPQLESTQTDTIPTGEAFWQILSEVSGGESFRTISEHAGVVIRNRRRESPLRRSTVAKLSAAFPHPRLEALGHGDVYWDEIAKIEPDGAAEVYDLTVPQWANFVANDLIIHNSTLLTQMAMLLAESHGPVLYVSGEESERQIKMRVVRLTQEAQAQDPNAPALSDNLFLLTETNLDVILEHIQNIKPRLVIIDSIQTVYLQGLTSTAGSVSQVRECAARLQELAKTSGVAVFLIGHVTKEGTIAGPRVLEHIVDTVLQLEGDRYQAYRLLRAAKNRFGATSEVGVFEMSGTGMQEVNNPSEVFLAERMVNVPGSAIAVTMEGTRPILVEVQGLTTASTFGNPRRTPNGADLYRLLLIVAVLTKRANLNLSEQDIFVNVVGGLKIDEPAADLAIAAAIASSVLDRPVLADCALIGEIGLSGELRAVNQLPLRLREAKQLGFRRAVVPRALRKNGGATIDGLEVVQVRSIREALETVLTPRSEK
jgi:DNA repair protein RadA/Sms